MTQAQAKEEVLIVPLSDITARVDWNGRFTGNEKGELVWTKDSGAEDGLTNDFGQLRISIRDRGQDVPVIGRRKGKKIDLVEGFRRYFALKMNAEESKDPNPTIKVIIRELTDLEARLQNVRGNTEREGFRPADLVWSVREVKREYEKAKAPFTQEALGADFGIAQNYVSKLLTIADKLDARIFDEWRAHPREIAVRNMYAVATKPAGEQREAWEALKKKADAPKNSKSAQQKTAEKVAKMQGEAGEFGWTIGQLYWLEVFGKVSADHIKAGLGKYLDTCVTMPKQPLTDKQRIRVVQALEDGFDSGNQEQEPGESDGEESAE